MTYTPDIVAKAFIDVGIRRGVNPIGIQEAICAGLDESGLRVLANPADPASMALPNDGVGTDHDSDGPLQQRGSQGWGTLQCRMDPACSVGLFYDRLVALPGGYTNLNAHTPGWYIQQVQNSFDATGSNYQKQWPTAVAMYNRLYGSTKGPGIPQANVDAAIGFWVPRIGNLYDYGGMLSPSNVKDGTDCSGQCDTVLSFLVHGNGGPVDGNGRFIRKVSTESWPYNYSTDLAVAAGTVGPYGTICAGDAQPGQPPTQYPPQIPSDAAAIIYLMHGGGGENSHMMIAVNDGTGNYIVMETGGNHNDTGGNGRYASPNGPATSTNNPEWTDIWYLPGPITSTSEGFLMALTDAQQNQLYEWVGDLHGSSFNSIASTSRFRALGEGAIWEQHQLPINDDGMDHPQYVEWAAERGDVSQLALLQALAVGSPVQYPDRAADIKLAQVVLARVTAVLSGATPPNVVVPNIFPVTPVTPAPAPVAPVVVPDAVAGIPITTTQLATWGRDLTAVLGVVATLATSLHDLLGQFFSGGSAVAVPSLLAAGTVAAGWSTVHHKNQAVKTVRALARAQAGK